MRVSRPNEPKLFFELLRVFLLGAWPCLSFAANDGSNDVEVVQTLRKAQSMIRQMAAERQRIEQVYAVKDAENQALKQRIQALETQVQSLEKALENSQHEQQRVTGAYRQQITQARSVIQDSQRQVQTTIVQNQQLSGAYQGCRSKAKTLEDVNDALVNELEEESLWDSIVELEPLTGIGRVERENRLQQYRDRVRLVNASKATCE